MAKNIKQTEDEETQIWSLVWLHGKNLVLMKLEGTHPEHTDIVQVLLAGVTEGPRIAGQLTEEDLLLYQFSRFLNMGDSCPRRLVYSNR